MRTSPEVLQHTLQHTLQHILQHAPFKVRGIRIETVAIDAHRLCALSSPGAFILCWYGYTLQHTLQHTATHTATQTATRVLALRSFDTRSLHTMLVWIHIATHSATHTATNIATLVLASHSMETHCTAHGNTLQRTLQRTLQHTLQH